MIQALCVVQLQRMSKNFVERSALFDTGLNRLGMMKGTGFSAEEAETFADLRKSSVGAVVASTERMFPRMTNLSLLVMRR